MTFGFPFLAGARRPVNHVSIGVYAWCRMLASGYSRPFHQPFCLDFVRPYCYNTPLIARYFPQPAGEWMMGKVLGKYANSPPKEKTEAPEARTALETPGRNVIFGTRKNQKSIVELAAAGFVVAGLIHLALAWNERGFSVIALLFSAFHGALLGMLIGQLIWVYPDRVMIAFASIGAFLGEVAGLGATGRFSPFHANRDTFQVILAVAFWFGFIGFWIGFIAFAKRLRRRWRYHEHLERMDIYPESDDEGAQDLFPQASQPSAQGPEEDQFLEPETPPPPPPPARKLSLEPPRPPARQPRDDRHLDPEGDQL